MASEGILDSASLLVNGTAVNTAIQNWKNLKNFKLFLHLCLTEGKAIGSSKSSNDLKTEDGKIKASFIQLMYLSMLPNNSSKKIKLREDLKEEIIAQINNYKSLTGLTEICLDDHQHIHLVPIVLSILIEISGDYKITWVRTTSEPLPTGLPFKLWLNAFSHNGFIKWLLLQFLSERAKPKLREASIKTNISFAGILFTGRMIMPTVIFAWEELSHSIKNKENTAPILLIHPSASLSKKDIKLELIDFHLSKDFLASSFRQMEWKDIKMINS